MSFTTAFEKHRTWCENRRRNRPLIHPTRRADRHRSHHPIRAEQPGVAVQRRHRRTRGDAIHPLPRTHRLLHIAEIQYTSTPLAFLLPTHRPPPQSQRNRSNHQRHLPLRCCFITFSIHKIQSLFAKLRHPRGIADPRGEVRTVRTLAPEEDVERCVVGELAGFRMRRLTTERIP